jgi:hypothetical protein
LTPTPSPPLKKNKTGAAHKNGKADKDSARRLKRQSQSGRCGRDTPADTATE